LGVLLYLIVLFLSGLFIGALGRLAIPGPDPMGLFATAAIGLAGSFIGGLIWWLISGHNGGGIVLSVICAAGLVYLVRRSRGGTLTQPGARP
jgi:uncharacterized membrane protein YeaQ/YmgE (transglycosylase-associated protein family)